MRIRIALTAFFCLAAGCTVFAQSRTMLSAPSSSGKNVSRGIFDIATSSDAGKSPSPVTMPISGRSTVTASPFGTTRKPTARRWKTNSKIADCIRSKAIPSNTNLSLSGTITGIITDGRYVIVTMFDSVETVTENGVKGDVPVTYTVVLDVESVAGDKNIKEGTKKSFVVDSNYAYLVWDDSGCSIRAVDNALTEPDLPASSGSNTKNR